MKNNYWGIILGLGQESLGIFEQYMTQRNYENYLGIFGWTEIQVALQPRADKVIPSIEKRNIPEKKEIRVWSSSEVA